MIWYCTEKCHFFEKWYSEFLGLRVEIKASLNGKTMVALIIGQSNAANYCQNKYESQNNVLNFYNSNFYRAKDPLLGASGNKGSIWPYLGDILINKGLFDNVVVVPIAQGSTKVEDWLIGGKFDGLFTKTVHDLRKNDLMLTHVIYWQGEQDNQDGTTRIQYQESLNKLVIQLRDYNISCPIFITLTSFTPSAKNKKFVNQDIRAAQSDVILENHKVYHGPDTDVFNKVIHRYDGIHLSDVAIKAIVESWVTILKSIED